MGHLSLLVVIRMHLCGLGAKSSQTNEKRSGRSGVRTSWNCSGCVVNYDANFTVQPYALVLGVETSLLARISSSAFLT